MMARTGNSAGLMLHRLWLVLVLLAAVPAGAATVQEDFDAAQAHLDALRLPQARAGFAALLDRLGASKSRSAMIVRSRLGETLIAMGDVEEAEPLLETALAGLPASNANAADERAAVLTHLARAAEEHGKLRQALGHWQAILTENLLPPGSLGGLQARLGAARTGQWTQPDVAARLLDGLLAEPASAWGAAKAGISGRLLVLRLKGQLAMRLGRLDEAKRVLDEAGKLAGGTSSLQVNLDDVQLRGDLIVLAWLKQDMASVVRLTAMSGASMLDEGGSRMGGAGDLPPCAPTGSLAPDAMAVIEFSVRDDGRVLNVRPIYASPGSGPPDSHPEEEFTAAVHGWSWPADQAKATNPLWRAAIRVELRCQTVQPDVLGPSLFRDYVAWLAAKGLPRLELSGSDAQRRPQLLAAVDSGPDRAKDPNAIAALPLLVQLVGNQSGGRVERRAFAQRLDALAEFHQAPTLVQLIAQSALAESAGDQAAVHRRLIPLAEQRGEQRLADHLRLLQIENRSGPEAEAELAAIAARHGEADPLRIKALIMLSDRAFARGAEAAAASALASTGLSPQQCALVDVRPQGRNAYLTSNDFPAAAQTWGLSALMRVAHDVTPAGDIANVRVITARPPFAFSEQTVKRMQVWRFKPVLRGTQSVGCVGRVQPIRFRLN